MKQNTIPQQNIDTKLAVNKKLETLTDKNLREGDKSKEGQKKDITKEHMENTPLSIKGDAVQREQHQESSGTKNKDTKRDRTMEAETTKEDRSDTSQRIKEVRNLKLHKVFIEVVTISGGTRRISKFCQRFYE